MKNGVIKSDWIVYEQPIPIRVHPVGGDVRSVQVDAPPTVLQESGDRCNYALEAIAEEEADEMIEEAKRRAEEILELAKQQAEEISESARTSGYQDGYQNGIQETEVLQKQCRDTIVRIESMAFDKYKTALENAEHDVVRMIMDISEKVIYDRLSDRQDAIVQLVRNAMQKASLEETLTLKVSPMDYEYLKRHQELIFEEHQLSNQVSMVQDATLTTGSCVIETATGTMDASVGTVLKNIDESFSDLSPRIAG